MTVQFALFLSSDGIALAHRQTAGHWAFLGDTTLASETLEADLAGLRAKAEERAPDNSGVLVVLPDDQLLYTSLTAPTDDAELTIYRIEDGLDGLTPYAVPELAYDWRVFEQDRVKLAVVARETLDEARAFAASHGFETLGFAAMPPLERFPGVPMFELSGPAEGLTLGDDGLAFGLDDWATEQSQTEAEKAARAKAEAEAEAAKIARAEAAARAAEEAMAAATEAELAIKAAERAAQMQALAAEEPESSDPVAPPQADAADPDLQPEPEYAPEPEQDPVVWEDAPADPAPQSDPDDVELATPEPEQKAARYDRVDPSVEPDLPDAPMPISDPMLSATIAPLEDITDPEPPASEPAPKTGRSAADYLDDFGETGDDDLPPAPASVILDARRKAETASPKASGTAATPSAPSFSARRSAKPPASPSSGGSVGERRSRIGFGRDVSADKPILHPDVEAKPAAKPRVGTTPKGLSKQLERLREASKTRTKAKLPPIGATTTNATTRRSPIPSNPTPGIDSEAARRADRALTGGLSQPPAPARTNSDGPKRGGQAASALSALSGLGGKVSGIVGRARESAGKATEMFRPRSALAKPSAPEPARVAPKPAARKPVTPKSAGGKGRLSSLVAGGSTPVAARPPTAATRTRDPLEDADLQGGFLANRTRANSGNSAAMRTGLIVTAVLLVVLALIALGSALLLPNSPVARLLFGAPTTVASGVGVEATAPDVITAPPAIGMVTTVPAEDDSAAIAAPQAFPAPTQRPDRPVEDVAALPDAVEPQTPEVFDIDDEIVLPPLPPLTDESLPSLAEAQVIYDASGIWPRTPARPDLPPLDLQDSPPVAALDPDVAEFDALALPGPGVNADVLPRRLPSPLPFGTEITTDERGLVVPTPDGVRTPAGAFVIAGRPPVEATPRPREIAPPPSEIDTIDDTILGTFRPTPRPEDLSDLRERQLLGGLTITELAALRPEGRPLSAQEAAAQASLFPAPDAAAADGVDTITEAVATAPQTFNGTDLAIAVSLVPRTRPSNIDTLVANAVRAPAAPDAPVVETAAIAPAPSIPASATVARAATQEDALRLRDVNLLGVVGTASDRRATVRLPSGQLVRVSVGDELDGGLVAAIGPSTLQYVRRGRTVTLEIPG